MNYDQICEQLDDVLRRLEPALPLLQSSDHGARIDELRRDLEAGFYSIVLLGEFNRGKSTLLNALLGADLLPTDILPTTATIHVLRYSQDPLLRIHWRDGRIEDRPLSAESIRQFVSNAEGVEAVSYLELGLPSPLLAHGVVYIDTPGVYDLNRQRAEVTYQFVPRSDAVLFLLDANAAFRRTEAEFLECSVLASGVERLIFVVNFADMIEPEEHDSLMNTIRNRLAAALGTKSYPVLLISARKGIEAKLRGDQDQWEESGIPHLLAIIDRLQKEGPGSLGKARQYVRRAIVTMSQMSSELEHLEQLRESSNDELSQRLTALVRLGETDESRRSKLGLWAEEREREILAIIGKSLDSFGHQLTEEIRDMVTAYVGTQFKQLVQEKVPVTVRVRAKSWVELHANAITQLLAQLHQALVVSLEREFSKKVLQTGYTCGVASDCTMTAPLAICAKDVSNSYVVAGWITGGVAGALMLVGAPMLIPVVGMAGLPLLQRAVLEYQLNEAKAQALPEINRLLRDVTDGFASNILAAVKTEIRNIRDMAKAAYDQQVAASRQQTEAEMEHRRTDQRKINDDRVRATACRKLTQDLTEELRAIMECTSEEVAVI